LDRPVVVYASLGKRKDELLVDYARFAKKSLNARFILIASQPRHYIDFPGEVLEYVRTDHTEHVMGQIKNARRNLTFVANGYWFFTYERFLALKILEGKVESDCPVVHMENDILSFISNQHLDIVRRIYSKTAILRWGELANGGVLYAPSFAVLDETIEHIVRIGLSLRDIRDWALDMHVLRVMLDAELVDELPTVNQLPKQEVLELTKNLYIDSQRVLFDGNELGSYLLGQNSVYSSGRILKGQKAVYTKWPIENTQWRLSTDNTNLRLNMKYQDEIFNVAMLHVSSKLNLIKNSNELLYNLFPLNRWFGTPNFPLEGISVKSMHSEKIHNRLVRKFLNLFS
jgi:hypothetical protein